MAIIKFACPHCNRPLKGNDTMQGKTLNCPACKSQITVPAPPSPSSAVELHLTDQPLTPPPHKPQHGTTAKRQWGSGRPMNENAGSFPLERRSDPRLPESHKDVQRFAFTKDSASLTRFLKVMLWIFSGLAVVAIFSGFAQLSLISSPNFTAEEAQANNLRQSAIGIVQLAGFIITGIAFLIWIHRANVNCRGFGAKDMKFTAGWSIGYYFIPIVSFYKPYYAMKEIWQASQNPNKWMNQSTSPLLGLWWTLWIIWNLLRQIAYQMSARAESLEAIKSATIVTILSDLVDIPLCIVAIFLVAAIFSFQRRLVEQNR